MERIISGTATVKSNTTWIYAGHTLKILSKRDPSSIEQELELGASYKLCLVGTEFEKRYSNSPYTYIHANDLIVNEDEYQPYDDFIHAVLTKMASELRNNDPAEVYVLLRNIPVKILFDYLPANRQEQFKDLLK